VVFMLGGRLENKIASKRKRQFNNKQRLRMK
jgi:hypothetical protein